MKAQKITTQNSSQSAPDFLNMNEKQAFKYYLEHYDSEDIRKGKKSKRQYNGIFIFAMILLMIIISIIAFASYAQVIHPNGATSYTTGNVSVLDNFFYDYGDERLKANFSDIGIENTFEPLEKINVYFDDSGNIVHVSKYIDNDIETVLLILYSVFGPIVYITLLSFADIIIRRCRIGKDYRELRAWFMQELYPYHKRKSFEKLMEEKEFFDVVLDYDEMEPEQKRKYRIYKISTVVVIIAFFGFLIMYLVYNVQKRNALDGMDKIVIYVAVILFSITTNYLDNKMSSLRTKEYMVWDPNLETHEMQ